jgi:hypothetical protein
MRWKPRVLGSAQSRALSALGPALSRRGFYLGGGTAVALHLGHRRSHDLDWFTGRRYDDMTALLADLRDDGIRLRVSDLDKGTVHGEMHRTRVSLLEYRYPMLREPLRPPSLRCRVAALEDLASMKLSAVVQRGSKKDFIDLYAIAVEGMPLDRMLAAYTSKYGIADIAHVLYALTYFDDAEHDRMPVMLWDVSWPRIKRAIAGWASEIAR